MPVALQLVLILAALLQLALSSKPSWHPQHLTASISTGTDDAMSALIRNSAIDALGQVVSQDGSGTGGVPVRKSDLISVKIEANGAAEEGAIRSGHHTLTSGEGGNPKALTDLEASGGGTGPAGASVIRRFADSSQVSSGGGSLAAEGTHARGFKTPIAIAVVVAFLLLTMGVAFLARSRARDPSESESDAVRKGTRTRTSNLPSAIDSKPSRASSRTSSSKVTLEFSASKAESQDSAAITKQESAAIPKGDTGSRQWVNSLPYMAVGRVRDGVTLAAYFENCEEEEDLEVEDEVGAAVGKKETVKRFKPSELKAMRKALLEKGEEPIEAGAASPRGRQPSVSLQDRSSLLDSAGSRGSVQVGAGGKVHRDSQTPWGMNADKRTSQAGDEATMARGSREARVSNADGGELAALREQHEKNMAAEKIQKIMRGRQSRANTMRRSARIKAEGVFQKMLGAASESESLKPGVPSSVAWADGNLCFLLDPDKGLFYCVVTSSKEYPVSVAYQILGELSISARACENWDTVEENGLNQALVPTMCELVAKYLDPTAFSAESPESGPKKRKVDILKTAATA